ncbi:hypothetical protein ColLi_05225 [Colletotrichum liriopes]|uniref:Uncharacterized protein n=1 Tax=Colletotrichum liriopes TaxID=708192 RepID=A0AA37GKG2_9PEZI|nr:hypothetical protein ColLi_05225 [Colletotrichum liriopes]
MPSSLERGSDSDAVRCLNKIRSRNVVTTGSLGLCLLRLQGNRPAKRLSRRECFTHGCARTGQGRKPGVDVAAPVAVSLLQGRLDSPLAEG